MKKGVPKEEMLNLLKGTLSRKLLEIWRQEAGLIRDVDWGSAAEILGIAVCGLSKCHFRLLQIYLTGGKQEM